MEFAKPSGAEQAEQIAFAALERFGLSTNHVEAAQLMIEAAEALDESIAQQTREVFGMHGFGVCERSMPFVEFREDLQNGVLPHLVEGKQTAGLPGQLEYVPAYKQFYIAPEEEAAVVKLSWRIAAEVVSAVLVVAVGNLNPSPLLFEEASQSF